MTRRLPADLDAITRSRAAEVLGIGGDALSRLRREGLVQETVGGRRLYSRREIESVAANPWLNASQVALILGVSRARVGQLASEGKMPFHLTYSGRRVFRHDQVQVVANARAVRWKGKPIW